MKDLGSIESELRQIQSELHQKANNHEIHAINSRLDSLEYSCRELSATFNEILFRLQKIEENQIKYD